MPPQDPETARWLAEHVQVHEPMLRAWLHSRFPNLEDLDDIVQEAYHRLLGVPDVRTLRFPKAFFFATARNLAYNRYRHEKLLSREPLGASEDFDVLDETADVAETVARNQEIELMTAAIQTLPDRCRQVLTLRYVYGLCHADIASQLGISPRTVEAQITTGIKRCNRYLAKYRKA